MRPSKRDNNGKLLEFNLPKKGDKVTFVEYIKWHWFTNVKEDEKKFLEIGKEYTVKTCQPASSSIYLTLEEIEVYDEQRGLPFFVLNQFDWENMYKENYEND